MYYFIQNNLLRKKNFYILYRIINIRFAILGNFLKIKFTILGNFIKIKIIKKLPKIPPKTTKTLYIFYKSLFKYFLNKNKYYKLKIRLLKKLLFTVKRNFISFGLKAILNRFKRLSL